MLDLGKKRIYKSGNEIYVIAEIGQNHQGDIEIAKQLIREAKISGCDCVKFQKSFLSSKFTRSALERAYTSPHSWGSTYGEHKRFLEFSTEQYIELQSYCEAVQIDFSASAMDEEALHFLDTINVPFIKIGSGDANNFPLLEQAAALTRPLIISTGMQTMETIEKIVEVMRRNNKTNYALLHCVSCYPTAPEHSYLQMIPFYRNHYPDIVIGYSGHEMGLELTQAAVLLGAVIVERHFTLSKALKGSDHKCSLEPQELQTLINTLTAFKKQGLLQKAPLDQSEILSLMCDKGDVELALKAVDGKVILPCELSVRNKLGKSIVAADALQKGHRLQPADICIKVSEPNGIPAEYYTTILGTELQYDIEKDKPITNTILNTHF